MRELFAWQMVGNTLSLTGQLFANLLLSKVRALGMTALALGTMVVWWATSELLIAANGAVGATQAYAMTYALYLMVTASIAFLVIKRIRRQARAESVA